ncbi:MAG: riboflavin kinase [Patescibacteria group bacterium]
MIFHAQHIKGKGRGHTLGFPTINLEAPEDLALDPGIYASWVVVRNKTYKGALHYGPVPTFNEKEYTLEVYLLNITDETVPDTEGVDIEIDVVKRLREIKNFANPEDLLHQIAEDIKKVNAILS